MNIAVVETRMNGHHPEWCVEIARSLVENRNEVHIFYPDIDHIRTKIDRNLNVSMHTGPNSRDIESRFSYLRLYSLRRLILWIEVWRALSGVEKNRRKQFDWVFFPYLDALMMECPGFALLSSLTHMRPWSGIWFHPEACLKRSPMRGLSPLDLFRHHKCQGIGMLCENYIPEIEKKVHKRVSWVPDVCFNNQLLKDMKMVQEIQKQAIDRCVIGIFGALNKRKGLLDLIHISQQLPEDKFMFVVVGRVVNTNSYSQDELDTIKSFIKAPPANVWVRDEWMENEEFNALLNCLDVLWVAYRQFEGSSNMLIKAATYQVPVLAQKGRLIAKRVEEFSLGQTVNLDNWQDPTHDLLNLCRMKNSNSPAFVDGCKQYLSTHSLDNFHSAIRELIPFDKKILN